MKTLNEDGTGQLTVDQSTPQVPQARPMAGVGQTTINIPTKVAVPALFFLLGWGVCWWMTRPKRRDF